MTEPLDQVQLEWEELSLSPLINYPKLTLRLVDMSPNCSSHSKRSDDPNALTSALWEGTNEFSCLKGRIQLSRRLSYYAIRFYGPSFLIVITSFMGFWMPVLAWPARIAIIITPLLTLVTQQSQISSEVQIHYVCALHIWMVVCQGFVFGCLVEYALAIGYSHRIADRKERNKSTSNLSLNSAAAAIPGKHQRRVTFFLMDASEEELRHSWSPSGLYDHKKKRCCARGMKLFNCISAKLFGPVDWSANPLDRNMIDYFSRLLFPVLWVVFVISYWFTFVLPWIVAH